MVSQKYSKKPLVTKASKCDIPENSVAIDTESDHGDSSSLSEGDVPME
jgi:hypothetical protein